MNEEAKTSMCFACGEIFIHLPVRTIIHFYFVYSKCQLQFPSKGVLQALSFNSRQIITRM